MAVCVKKHTNTEKRRTPTGEFEFSLNECHTSFLPANVGVKGKYNFHLPVSVVPFLQTLSGENCLN